ncbi:MAG TPA: glycoside hydrolase family 31 protein [Candidatus Acidoferrales bacterium]|nr:glycoside hydrolase family 31 protein [Candidatus Acidoferrales bacterium]
MSPTLSSLGQTNAGGGWATLGAMSAPAWDGKTLRLQSGQGTLAITALSDDVVRVRFTTGPAFGRDHSYAVVTSGLGAANVKTELKPDATVLTTASLTVTVQHSPLRISFANAAGALLDADDPARGLSLAGSEFRIAKQLRDDDHVYGFGEKCGRLDKRGQQLGGYNYVMWNSDTPAYDSATDPLYVDVPFFMVTRRGQAHGIFLDNTWRSFFDVGREQPGLLTFGADGGDVDYYFINGPAPKQVLERYTALTGRMPLPPLWSLGYQQCRWSYYPEARVRLLADTFRVKRVPADALWLDIHYMDGYKPFTWNAERFPNPAKMIADLRAQGFRLVTILDGHPPALKGYAPYESGLAGGHFVKWPDGRVFEGPVWPSQAEKEPAPSVFPDFSRPATREWWGDLYKSLLDVGVAGIWNDMDEPSVFDTPNGTMPMDVVFDNEGEPATSRQMHNLYGQLMSRSTFEGLSRLRPDERAFVLTRSSFAGGQRYAAVWTGDATADWSSLRQSVAMLMGLGLSGFPFVGSDIGGFVRMPSAELCTRWLQVGVFSPFMRMHTEIATPDKEPWSFGWRYEAINKAAIELRYQLLPYIYNVMQQASETGVPAMRPLFVDFPEDGQTAKTDDEFLFGDDLLVAPVLWEGVDSRDVYLPAGDWFDYWTGRKYAGNATIQVPVTIHSIPLFVRGGGFLFRQPVVQHTGEMPGQPLQVLVAPAASSEGSFYEDDGKSLAYRQGGFMKRAFHQAREAQSWVLDVGAPAGSYRPAKRDLILETWLDHEPKAVTEQANGAAAIETLPRLSAADLAKAPRGWSFAGGVVVVKDNDGFGAVRFVVQY